MRHNGPREFGAETRIVFSLHCSHGRRLLLPLLLFMLVAVGRTGLDRAGGGYGVLICALMVAYTSMGSGDALSTAARYFALRWW